MSIVVSDTWPVRALMHLGLFPLVHRYFDDPIVPPAVATELEQPAGKFSPILVSSLGGVRIVTPTDRALVTRLRRDLDPGESEAIALAVEVRPAALLIDEAKGRAVAQSMGIARTGVMGLLARAKRDGHVPLIKPLVDELRRGLGFHVSQSFYDSYLRSIGE